MVTEIADRKYIEETERVLNQPPPTAQWYRADGVPLPNLLPSDPYHRALYSKKGWSLTPPASVVNGQGNQRQPLLSDEMIKKELGPVTVAPPPYHMHVMRDGIGSPCLVQGCEHKRTVPKTVYESRKPRKHRGGH